MFDALLRNPLVLSLPPILSVVFGFVLSRAVELIPSFAGWWDGQPNDYKLAYRGWAGLVLALLLVVFGYFSKIMTFQVDTVADWLILIAAVVISWLLYVGAAEGTYRATADSLPRKQPGWEAE